MPTTRGYPLVTYQDAPRGPEQMNAVANAVDTDVAAVDVRVTNTRAVADNALNTARDAHEVPVVRAQVVAANIVTASGSRGSIALDTTVMARPTSGRTPNSPTRVVASKPGTYRVKGRAVWSGVSGGGGALGRRFAQIRRSAASSPTGGTDLTPGYDRPVTDNLAHVIELNGGMWDFALGDYAELFVEHSQGSGLAVLGGNGGTYLELEFVRPLP